MNEKLHEKNLNLAKRLYQRYCLLMDRKDRKANTSLSMWFTMVEQTLKSSAIGKENTK